VDPDRTRVSSIAFYDGIDGETSCYLDTPSRRLRFATRYPERPVARFSVGHARQCGFSVTSDPEGDPENDPEHILLTHSQAGISRGMYQKDCKRLALLCEYISPNSLAL
jgi:hypothetical protein